MKDTRGSITQDANPEGINQYTGAAARAEKLGDRAMKSVGTARNSSRTESTSKGKAMLARTAAAHSRSAGDAHTRAASLATNKEDKQYHQQMAAGHHQRADQMTESYKTFAALHKEGN